jgi:hypothetical protein
LARGARERTRIRIGIPSRVLQHDGLLFPGVEYLLDTNSVFTQRADVKDEEMDGNRIDARWVDADRAVY